MMTLSEALLYVNSLDAKIELTLTGSTVFGSSNPRDIDFFGLYSEELRQYLLEDGFELCQDYNYDNGDIVLQKDNLDIIFPALYNDYYNAHTIAKKLKLREKYPAKSDFLMIFNAMRGRFYNG